MSNLFSGLKIKDIKIKNRIGVSPMCQYSAIEGHPTQWHLVHLGSRAVGGAGLVIQEATAVSPEGRISTGDLGIWDDAFIESYCVITDFLSEHNCIPAIQLAHAGRKASTYSPFSGKSGSLSKDDGGWFTYAPSEIPFNENYNTPVAMTQADIDKVIWDFKCAAERSIEAGYKIIELHFAHGYLINEFLSPLTNKRTDMYGGSFQNRIRLALEIISIVRKYIPESIPLFVRISASEWFEGGWSLDDSIELSKLFMKLGVDLVDCSSGGNIFEAKIPVEEGYQIKFAEDIKNKTGILSAAVGLISSPEMANKVIENNQADIVLLGREMLRNPYWAIFAAEKLNWKLDIPVQYRRAY